MNGAAGVGRCRHHRGGGASATDDINVTVYGHKGTAVVAVTVFNDATDPAGSAKALAAKAIAAL